MKLVISVGALKLPLIFGLYGCLHNSTLLEIYGLDIDSIVRKHSNEK